MSDILSRLAALTAKDSNGLLPCPLCGKPAKASRGTHQNAQLWSGCPSKLCLAGQDECTPGVWNARPREAALIALVQEAAGEIERMRKAMASKDNVISAFADIHPDADVIAERALNPQKPTS
jgi:hypothetical protein